MTDYTCTKCNETKPEDLFKKDKKRPRGRSSWCKTCHSAGTTASTDRAKANANNAKYKQTEKGKAAAKRYRRGRRAMHRKARPEWNDHALIDTIYADAEEQGLHVDHIVPLRSNNVCGLHTQANLEITDPKHNQAKGNRHWPDMW